MGKFYAVFRGKKPGVYMNWSDCKEQVTNFKGCRYKSFLTKAEADYFVKNGSASNDKTITTKFTQEKASNIDTDTLLEIFGEKDDDDFFDDDDDDKLAANPEKSSATTRMSNLPKNNLRKRKLPQEKPYAKKTKVLTHDPVSSGQSSGKLTRINGIEYTVDNQSRPIVYTDGACSNNGKKQGSVRAGYGVWWGENHPLNLSCRLQGTQTNQRAEIAAVNACLEQAIKNGIKSLTIKTDSMFIINCVTKWMQGWLRKNWIKSDGKPVIHKEEFLLMLPRLKLVKVNWEHVRGHRGIHGNEMADRLAVRGATL